MQVVIVAGEASGDILGAGLIQSLKKLNPELSFIGIGGPKMLAQGFTSLFPMERLSVMGFVEPLKRLPELLHIRKTLKKYCVDNKISLFIGIDAPDFNLPLERFLKQQTSNKVLICKTVHYVSPSVWAWRQGRIKKIKKSVDLMLTFLPFEAAFYEKHQVPVRYVGHTLADDININPDMIQARENLNLPLNKKIIALMPGSRGGEVELLAPLFLQVAIEIQKQLSDGEFGDCEFLIPAANEERYQQLLLQIKDFSQLLTIHLYDGQSHVVMEASDAVLLASGTTALEAMLLKKPMVVAYKMTFLTHAIVSRLLKSKFVSLPNLLADEMIVPELMQDKATVKSLVNELFKAVTDETYREKQIAEFYKLHNTIRCDASMTAAKAILDLME